MLRKLRRHFRLVLVGNRGSGRSDLLAGPFGVTDMAGDVVAVLDDAGVRRAHTMGVSLGGMVAQELAIDHPDQPQVMDRLVELQRAAPADPGALLAQAAAGARYAGRLRQRHIRARAPGVRSSAV